ncbi:MAG: hypothetical protein GF416_01225 [Candidatus Altiarchaeales archaeon]|nr:hypothetical protein [Candidatus Altiarchaeales archaeon]MBD3415737.1 hypothetical protein [Candidatus Altiarchaeales archaeon]
MMEYTLLHLLLTLMVWCDVLVTYLCFRKVRGFGFPNWINEDTSPLYRFYVRRLGLEEGMIAAAMVNPLLFIVLARTLTHYLKSLLGGEMGAGLSFGLMSGMILMSVIRNMFYYQLPREEHNRDLLGDPERNKAEKLKP